MPSRCEPSTVRRRTSAPVATSAVLKRDLVAALERRRAVCGVELRDAHAVEQLDPGLVPPAVGRELDVGALLGRRAGTPSSPAGGGTAVEVAVDDEDRSRGALDSRSVRAHVTAAMPPPMIRWSTERSAMIGRH